MHLGVLYPPCHQRPFVDSNFTRSAVFVPATPLSRRSSRTPSHLRQLPGASPSGRDAASSGNTGGTGPNLDQKRAEIATNVDRAARMVGEIVDEVTREMFVSEAVAYLQEDKPDQSEQHAVRMAVMSRLEFLDANFLTTLGGFIHALTQRGDKQMADLLVSIRDEVLRQVSSRMPSAAQVLDSALRHADRDARLDILRAAVSGGKDDIPAAELDTLAATASKFIDEMEEQPEIPDRRLLARLVLLREELRWLREEARFNDDAQPEEPVRSNVPQRCAAFVKELVVVTDPLRRAGLLAQALEKDWEGAAPRQKPQTSFQANQPDMVRPGRLMATLQSMVVQLRREVDTAGVGAGAGETSSGGGSGSKGIERVIERLEIIRTQALAVLDRIQSGGVAPSPDSSTSQSGGSGAGGSSGGAEGSSSGSGADGGAGEKLDVVEPVVVEEEERK